MELGEIINISKINEGFFISDKLAALNPCLLLQFKITHIINATSSPVYNSFEQLGIKYFNLNWSEKSSQKLFDSQDTNANQIISFIDSALNNGQGLLAYSIKGNNRVCIVVLIFFMKKYLWTLNKSLDFLRSRKREITIPNYFLKQLNAFEQRLLERGFQLSNSWEEKDQRNKEEMVLRNTYVNGLPVPRIGNCAKEGSNKKVEWSSSLRMIANVNTDLYLQSVKKNVVSHLKCGKLKSCLKSSNPNIINEENNNNNEKDNVIFNLGKITFGPNNDLESHIDNQNDIKDINKSSSTQNEEYLDNPLTKKQYENITSYNNPNTKNANSVQIPSNNKKCKLKTPTQNTFYTNEKPLLPKRPSSSDKIKKLPYNSNNNFPSNINPPPIQNQVIINNNYGQIIQTNINNFYIQNTPDNTRLMNIVASPNTNPPLKQNNFLIRSTSAKPSSHHLNNNPHPIKLGNTSSSSQNYVESYLNNYQPLDKLPPQQNYHQFMVRNPNASSGKPLNNFNPSLLRKNNANIANGTNAQNPNYFNKMSHSKNLIKIKHESLRKPGTPDPIKAVYLHGANARNAYGMIGSGVVYQNKRVKTPTIVHHSNKNSVKRLYGYNNNMPNSKRSRPEMGIKRPGTAPNKDKTFKHQFSDNDSNKLPSTLKRLPSPMIKSMSMKREDKVHFDKYRVPSPVFKSTMAFGIMERGKNNK